jgi:type I restriction enzyme S subunit
MDQINSLKTEQRFKKTEIGEIPVDWEIIRLDEVCEVVGGSTPSTKNKEYWDGSIPWAVPTDITRLKGNIIYQTQRYITEKGLSSISAKPLPVGSILLTSRATIGECAINAKPMVTNQGFASLICKDIVYNWYILYLMIYLRKNLKNLSAGSTFREISKKTIRSIRIPLPPLPEQINIAKILSLVDESIENKKSIIEKTKELKKGLMQELLTRGIGHTKFKKTEIGEIPLEWKIMSLNDISEEIYRYPTYYNIQYVSQGIPEIRGEIIELNGKLDNDLSKYRFISNVTAARFPRTTLKEGDFVISVRGTMGKAAIVPKFLDGANITANLIRISPNRNIVFPLFLHQVFLSNRFQEILNTASSSTTIKTIKASELRRIKFAIPSIQEQKRIAQILSSWDTKIKEDICQYVKLEDLKNGLMQTLLTGKLRVRQ